MTNDHTKFYKNTQGVLFRTIGVGYSIETGEQMVALKQTDNGHTWFISMAGLTHKCLKNGVVVKDYTECTEDDEDVQINRAYPTRNGTNRSDYPGYTNDPRLEPVQKTSAGDRFQNARDNVQRKIQNGYYPK